MSDGSRVSSSVPVGLTWKDALLGFFNWIYEEWGDDLPSTVRLGVNAVRKLADQNDSAFCDLRKATKSDIAATNQEIREVLLQSKLGTEYAAAGMIKIREIADTIQKTFLEGTIDEILANTEKLIKVSEESGSTVSDDEAHARIEAAKMRLSEGETAVALDRLNELLERDMSPKARARATINVGCVLDYMGETRRASAKYLEATNYD